MKEKQIKIFDTTLRDGEQSPGFSMNLKEKVEMGKQLERMGVDIIEAGFAISSPGDFLSVKTLAETLKDCVVASLARTTKKDIDRAWEAVKGAVSPRIHIFLATSPLHMKYKLKMTEKQVLEQAVEMTKYARKLCPDVEFSAEDATRSDRVFLAKVIEAVIKAGASTVNLPDTVGYSTPSEIYDFFKDMHKKAPSLKTVAASCHCHNDLGLATANSLEAVRGGATQIECTVNGIGERAGNAAMEEVIMALHVRKDIYGAKTGLNTTEIMRSSNLLSRITGMKVQPNKAIVGANAFAHESGIHQHGVLAKAETYEIMTPASVGLTKNQLVLGKHSGKHAFADRLKSLGYLLTEEELAVAFEKFKVLADKKKQVYDMDIEAIIAKESVQIPRTFQLEQFVINCGTNISATSSVSLSREGGAKTTERVAIGSGPLSAAFNTINKIIGRPLILADFKITAVTEGEDAQGDAVVRIRTEEGASYTGRGLSTDVVEASVMAYINAVNKMYYAEKE
jgi:2-isopropylmalate synthase